jgi:hypothetical protein
MKMFLFEFLLKSSHIINESILIARSFTICNSTCSDHVWLHYHSSLHPWMRTNNFRVRFKCKDILHNP